MRSIKSISQSKTIANNIASPKPYKLYTLIAKYRSEGYDTVADFLDTKARRSKQTAFLYASGVKNLNRFIIDKYKDKGKYNVQTILPDLKTGKEDVYKLLDNFVSHLENDTPNGNDLSPKTIQAYMASARSYFQYNDIDILPSRFKNKVTMPRIDGGNEEAIDANDIKEILHHCDNRRLKAYLLVLASSGVRAMEALGIRECDVDFNGIDFDDPHDTSKPAIVKIRKEFSKSKRNRTVFISNEAARFLHQWINWIYRDKSKDKTTRRITRQRMPDHDLVFSRRTWDGVYPTGLYNRLLSEFQKVLQLAHLSTRKEDGVYKRRKITMHSFRRFVRTTIGNETGDGGFGEHILGHADNPYYTTKPEELKKIYKEKCMKYLTFLDYPTLQSAGKSIEANLTSKLEWQSARIKELEERIRHKDDQAEVHTSSIGGQSDQIIELQTQIKQLTEIVKKAGLIN